MGRCQVVRRLFRRRSHIAGLLAVGAGLAGPGAVGPGPAAYLAGPAGFLRRCFVTQRDCWRRPGPGFVIAGRDGEREHRASSAPGGRLLQMTSVAWRAYVPDALSRLLVTGQLYSACVTVIRHGLVKPPPSRPASQPGLVPRIFRAGYAERNWSALTRPGLLSKPGLAP